MNSENFDDNLLNFDGGDIDSSTNFNKIEVFVDSGAGFISYTNKIKIITLTVENGTTYIEAIAQAGIPVEQVGFLAVNSIKKDLSAIASDKDVIRPLPFIVSG